MISALPSRRSDVLNFETDTLQEDATLAGPSVAEMQVALSTSDVDFIIKLIDVFPDIFNIVIKTSV